MKRKKEFNLKLKEAGYKTTPNRVHLIDVFSKASRPISIEYILEKARAMNTATVYRNLISMQKAGLIRKLDLQKGEDLYELINEHHHHIICRGCGVYEDFKLCHVEELSQKTLSHSSAFATITDHSLEFYGYCTTCVR